MNVKYLSKSATVVFLTLFPTLFYVTSFLTVKSQCQKQVFSVLCMLFNWLYSLSIIFQFAGLKDKSNIFLFYYFYFYLFIFFWMSLQSRYHLQSTCFFILLFIYLFFIYFYQLEANYFTRLQWFLSYIDVNQPWIYMYSPSQSPLPPPSPPDPSGSSQCTRSEHLTHASDLGW